MLKVKIYSPAHQKLLKSYASPVFSLPIARILLCLALSTLFLVSGCAWIRNDTPPMAEVEGKNIKLAPDLTLGPNGWKDAWPEQKWWQEYNDSQLNAIVEKSLAGSPTLAVLHKRAELAIAKAKLVGAKSGPVLGLDGNITRMHVSDAGFLGPFAEEEPLLGLTGPWYTSGTIELEGKFELDLWGKHRSQVEAALGVYAANLAEVAQAELVISTTVVKLYYEMQTLFALQDVLQDSLNIENMIIVSHEAKLQRGVASQTLVEQEKAGKARIEQELSSTKAALLVLRETLRAMSGENVADGANPVLAIIPSNLPENIGKMPETLSYVLLARRPDLQAARHYIESSLHGVDAAKAAFYPDFNLQAVFGLDSLHLDTLFKRGSQQFNLIGALSLPIFDSGQLNANLKVVRTESDLSIASYNAAVVNAVKEVAEAAIQMRKTTEKLSLQEQVSAGNIFAWKSAESYYRNGLSDKVTVEQARLPVLMNKSKELELKNQQIQAEIGLIKALGGGYRPLIPAKK